MFSETRSFAFIRLPTVLATCAFFGASFGAQARVDLVGTLPGDVAVDNKGSANYSMPLTLPPGRMGMQPSLTLAYNSGGGNGPLGAGFNLSTGFAHSITRGRTILARDGEVRGINFDDGDKFYLDGKRLICVSGTYGYADSVYRTEVDSFIEVVAFGTDAAIDGFRVRQKDGTILCFGKNVKDESNATVYTATDGYFVLGNETTGSAMSWALKWVEDPVGNYVELRYDETDFDQNGTADFALGNGEHVLTSIRYTGNRRLSVAPEFKIWLRHNDPNNASGIPATQVRPDGGVSYSVGRLSTLSARLDRVRIYDSSSSLAQAAPREYSLVYNPSASPGFLRLQEVYYSDNSGAGADTRSTVFSWGAQSPTMAAPEEFNFSGRHVHRRVRGDFNGDGRDDLLLIADGTSNPAMWIAYSGDLGHLTEVETPFGSGVWAASLFNNMTTGDFNGDGRTDLAWLMYGKGSAGGGWYVALSTATGFGPAQRVVVNFENLSVQDKCGIPSAQAVDLDGDGLDELFFQVAYPTITIDLGWFDGDDNEAFSEWTGSSIRSTGYSFISGTGPLIAASPKFSGGSLTWTEHTVTNPYSGGTMLLQRTDLDGDGKADFLAFGVTSGLGPSDGQGGYTGSIDHQIRTVRNVGNWTLEAGPSLVDGGINCGFGGFGTLQGDINGDGLDDILVLRFGSDANLTNVSGSWDVGLSKGNGEFDFTSYAGIPAVLSAGGQTSLTFNQQVPDVSTGTTDPGDGGVPEVYLKWAKGCEINGVQLIDFNGDGRKDFIWYDRNTGWHGVLAGPHGFDNANVFSPFGSSSDPVDYHYLGWEPWGVGVETFTTDIDGNGREDLIMLYPPTSGFTGNRFFCALSPSIDTNRVVAVTNGTGAVTGIDYGLTTDPAIYTTGTTVAYPIRESRRAQRVVSDVFRDTGATDANVRAHYSYQYSGNRVDLSGRGPLGFHSFVTLDRQTNLFKYQFLAQSFPMTGLTAREQTYRYWEPAGGTEIKFRLLESHDNTVVFDEVVDAGGGAWGTVFPYISQAVEKRWENSATAHYTWPMPSDGGPSASPELLFPATRPSGEHISVAVQSWFDNQLLTSGPQTTLPGPYNPSDATGAGANAVAGMSNYSAFVALTFPQKITFGNLRKLSTDFGGGFTETVTTTYHAPATVGNLTGLAASVEKSVVSPGFGTEYAPTLRYTYATVGARQTSLVASETTDADRTEATVGPLDLTKTYSRDTRGRVESMMISGFNSPGHLQHIGSYTESSITAFSDRFDLPTTVKNAYLNATTSVLDGFTAQPTSVTDPNDAQTTIQHDALGRAILTTDVLKGLESGTTFAWTNDDASDWTRTCTVTPPPGLVGAITRKSVFAIRTTATVQPASVAYFDRLGRTIRVVKEGFGTQTATSDTIFDHLGQVAAVSLPYAQGQTPLWTTTAHDDLGRPETIVAPNTTVTTNVYNGRVTQSTITASDRDPQVTTTLVDPKGRTTKVWNADNTPAGAIDPVTGPGTTASVAYTLDGFGRVRTTTLKGQSATIDASYDALGQQASLSDPDKGPWTYVNNAIGQVVQQTDAKLNVTESRFDRLGRQFLRTTTEPSGPVETAKWYYFDAVADASRNAVAKGDRGWIGALHREESSITGAPSYSSPVTSVFYFNSHGLPEVNIQNLDGHWFHSTISYDVYWRPNTVRYLWRPETHLGAGDLPYLWRGYGLTKAYDGTGATSKSFVVSISDDTPAARVWWQAHPTAGYDFLGRVALARKGNGHWTQREFRPQDGLLSAQRTGTLSGTTVTGVIQSLGYTYDGLGNLASRANGLLSLSETFGYDTVNRLTTLNGSTIVSYADNGNINTKVDVNGTPSGVYSYASSRPHAVTSAWGFGMTYDANGNLATRTKSATSETWGIRWAGFDKPRWMAKTRAGVTRGSEFGYDASRNHVVELEFDAVSGGVPSHYTKKTLHALGKDLEVEFKNGQPAGQAADWSVDKARVYVRAPDGLVGAMEFQPNAPLERMERGLVYHLDHLGSIEGITEHGSTGGTYALDSNSRAGRYSYDAWGERRNADTWNGAPVNTAQGGTDDLTPKGFTGHEMLDELGLVHMGGRIYDATVGRFLSADLFVQYPSDGQSYNRYSYVRNNALSLVDPSGLLDETSLGKRLSKFGAAGASALAEMETQAAAGWKYRAFDSDKLNANVGRGSVGGVTDRPNTTVYVHDTADMDEIADDLVHETEHTTQPAAKTMGDFKQHERDAYTKQAQFQIDTGRPGDLSKNVRDPATRKWVDRVDKAAIETHIQDHYPDAYTNRKTGKPVPDTQPITHGNLSNASFRGTKEINVNMVRLAHDAETAQAAASAAKGAAKAADREVKRTEKNGTPEEKAKAQQAAADAKAKAEAADKAATQAKEAAAQEAARLKQVRGY